MKPHTFGSATARPSAMGRDVFSRACRRKIWLGLFACMVCAGFTTAFAAGPPAGAAEKIRLGGKVVDAAGKAVAGASVEVFESGNYPGYRPPNADPTQQITTGSGGEFDVTVVRGTVSVLVQKAGFALGWKQYYNPANDLLDQTLSLTPDSFIAGRILDENDQPVANAEVWVGAAYLEEKQENGSSYSFLGGAPAQKHLAARSGADGGFRITRVPTNAVADLDIRFPGKVARLPEREYFSPENMQCRAGDKEVKVIVENAAVIEGRVVQGKTGEPVAGARINSEQMQRRTPGWQPRVIETGADGRFHVETAGGTYRLTAGYGTNTQSRWVAMAAQVTVEGGQTNKDVEIKAVPGGFLEVEVVGKESVKPMPGVTVSIRQEGFSAFDSTGSNGVALLHGVPGEYRVTAHQESAGSEEVDARVEEGRTNRLKIPFAGPPKIAGVVHGPDGAPMAEVEVWVMPNWGQSSKVKTDSEGRYDLPWTPQRFGMNGAFCLVARDKTRKLAASQDIEESTRKADLKLAPALRVTGIVRDVLGKAVTNANINCYLQLGNSGMPLDNTPIKADAQGHYEVTGLPAGQQYNLWANAPSHGSAYRNVEHGDDGTNAVEMEPLELGIADQPLAGEVLDADDKPVSGATVHTYGQGQPNASTRSDASGRFEFKVCEGSVQLSVNHRQTYGNARAQSGDTNVVVRLGQNAGSFSRQEYSRASIKGKPLPDLGECGLAADAAPAGKPLLIVLLDVEQRPSRRVAQALAEKQASLREKGINVVAVQIPGISAEAFKEWQDSARPAYPVSRIAEKTDKTKWVTGVGALPWLILADSQRRVAAEGFDLEDLDAKVSAVR